MYQRRRWHPTPVLLPGKIPWTEEPDRLQSMGSWRVGHDWAISLSLFTFMCIGEGNGNPLQCSCLENPRDGGAWWAAAYGVAQSRTRLKRLSSSSSSVCMSVLLSVRPTLSLLYLYSCPANRFICTIFLDSIYIYIYICVCVCVC